MPMPTYTKPEPLSLKLNPDYDEKWVQELIAQDPKILGLGDLILRDKERMQRRAGRLDLLLQDPETQRRYEVELQLGPSDESHIIRTIEYWDIERKRYPQYDHCAVIVAEDITSRFLNVVSLFNGAIPLIAVQMRAFKVGEHVTLVFTTVMDELTRGLVDEDEEAAAAATPTDRSYWEGKSNKSTMDLVDGLLLLLKEFDPLLALKFTKYYIGLTRKGRVDNFVMFEPKGNHVVLRLPLPRSDELDSLLKEAGLNDYNYVPSWKMYLIHLDQTLIAQHSDLLKDLMRRSYDARHS
jgi:hypothetical protein